MTVRGYDPYISPWRAPGASAATSYTSIIVDEIFRASDYISLNVPYTESTHHMIDADAIASMRPGVRIMNETRAEVVDDDAMIAALESGHVGKYVTDFPNKPSSSASRNCITTAAPRRLHARERGEVRRHGRAGDLRLPQANGNIQQHREPARTPPSTAWASAACA